MNSKSDASREAGTDVRAPKSALIAWAVATGLGVAAFSALRSAAHSDEVFTRLNWVLAVLATPGLVGAFTPYRSFVAPLGTFFRVVLIIPVIFFLGAGFPLKVAEFPALESSLVTVRVFGLATALLALWRPAFLIPALFSMSLYRTLFSAAFPSSLSQTDMSAAIEGPAALLLVLVAADVASRVPVIGKMLSQPERDAGLRISSNMQEWLFVGAIAVHLSNYFFSGVAKIELPGGWFHWLLHNPTWILAGGAADLKMAPFSHWSTGASAIIAASAALNPLVNAFTLGTQILAPIALFRRRWLIAITLSYDILHIGIFLLTGIFFWKWIILNLAIVLSLSRFNWKRLPMAPMLSALVVVLISPVFFQVARLGWYDTPLVTRDYLIALTDDGRRIEVPSNYFAGLSIGVAQMDASRLWPETSVATRTWGTTGTLSVFERANRCELINDAGKEDFEGRRKAVARVVRNIHRTMLAHADPKGRVNYDLYAHHIWSNPFEYGSFSRLDKRRISSYIWVEQIICVDKRRGRASRVLIDKSLEIPLSEPSN